MSLRAKIFFVVIFAFIILGASSVYFCFVRYEQASKEQQTQVCEGVAKLVAALIDPERVDEYIEYGEKAEGYLEVEKRLAIIHSTINNIKYIYVYKIMKDGCHVVFDLSTDDIDGDAPGTIIPFDVDFLKYVDRLLAGKSIEPIVSDGRYGWLLTTYVPIKNAKGECVAYAAADISMDWLKEQGEEFFFSVISICVVSSCIVGVLVMLYLHYYVIVPINKIAELSGEFAYTTEEVMHKSLNAILKFKVKTKDEIENLYSAFCKMAQDTVAYIESIKKKSEDLTNMQRALIVSLADLVESRDKNTGQHIRKTAAYAEIIMKQLKEKGYYIDQLTDDFIHNVVHSAPLHDIGKIKVPDAILNKPGRLTDEEFALMKMHASAGGYIIANIIKMVPESHYLIEARNLATYHHEKWNGTGYPNGIKGEEIPLSARIMAVADVFDALVSKRSYKEGFSYEKAFRIIQEESGTHFDPLVVEAFFAAKESVLEVADSFKHDEEEEERAEQAFVAQNETPANNAVNNANGAKAEA